MKVACISTSTVPSTTANAIQVMKVCQALAQTGAEVRLWLPGQANTAWEALAALYGLTTRFEITWLPAWARLKRYDFAWQAVGAAQKWGAEAVYTWLPQAALLALWRGLPGLIELHDRPTGKVGPWLIRQVARHPGKKRLLFITRALQTALEREQGLVARPSEAVIAPDGVDMERYVDLPTSDEARRRLGLPAGLTAVHTGHLYAGRGGETLLALAQAHPQVHFLWVGGRPEDVNIWRTRTKQLGLNNVSLTGFVDNQHIPLYQAAGDILLMPYERSVAVSGGGNTADICSPMKMFEYMAAGRAILTSDLPVLREALDESCAIFCAPEDRAAWLAGFSRLAADAQLRQRLGNAAKARAGQYAWVERARRSFQGL